MPAVWKCCGLGLSRFLHCRGRQLGFDLGHCSLLLLHSLLGLGHQGLSSLVGGVGGFLGVGHGLGLGLGNGSSFFFGSLQAGFSALQAGLLCFQSCFGFQDVDGLYHGISP